MYVPYNPLGDYLAQGKVGTHHTYRNLELSLLTMVAETDFMIMRLYIGHIGTKITVLQICVFVQWIHEIFVAYMLAPFFWAEDMSCPPNCH